jgi:hypothetical protein
MALEAGQGGDEEMAQVPGFPPPSMPVIPPKPHPQL